MKYFNVLRLNAKKNFTMNSNEEKLESENEILTSHLRCQLLARHYPIRKNFEDFIPPQSRNSNFKSKQHSRHMSRHISRHMSRHMSRHQTLAEVQTTVETSGTKTA